jgi:hypothetical protein
MVHNFMWVMVICTLHYNFVDWLNNTQHNDKKIEDSLNSSL